MVITILSRGLKGLANLSTVYYISHDDIRWDGSYTDTENTARFEITYKKNTDGKLSILKARAIKTDVSEAGLPEDIKIRVTENAS